MRLPQSSWIVAFCAVGSIIIAVPFVVAFYLPISGSVPPLSFPLAQIQFAPQPAHYDGNWIWYNFSITLVRGNIYWSGTTMEVANGSLGPLDNNSSLTLLSSLNRSVLDFTPSACSFSGCQKFATSLAVPALAGEVLSLKVDILLNGGWFAILLNKPLEGSYSADIP